MTRDVIVAEARSWIGTPFLWQASVKGRGADCKGLIVGVARALGLHGADSLHAAMADYTTVDQRRLVEGLAANLDRAEGIQPGNVLLLTIAGKAQHLAIVVGANRMIHTYGKGPKRVIEVPIGSRPIHSVWQWRGIDG